MKKKNKKGRWIEYYKTDEGDLAIIFGGMNFIEKIKFIKRILLKGRISIVIYNNVAEDITDLIDGYPVKKPKNQLYS